MKDLFNNAVKMFSGIADDPDIAAPPPPRQPRGMIDTAKLMEASERLQEMIAKENIERSARLQQLAESQARLEASVHNMFEQHLKATRIAHVERISGIAATIAEGVQGIVAAPKTARFKKTARFQTVTV